ncbi:hypothetical protein FB45DRAFT_68917 [Roridomyces roridus]|uniref:Zn(2)-C6 fungal-type domain-containing protein n=1 Tax=Roridomyces roridus TaxID=1738132 RepID=A0AAD7FL82_9AGAR|nr:hypothetical protein FB45DRAFT_68917 [Roridomyces roridus]
MSSSRKSAQKIAATADGDHRKRRRNRTTQSCLNCHTTKRMCDRKRPCSRCTQLGIGANCVYEVDDPNRQSKEDEGARLMKRVAELEEVIRELKNKPPPRPASSQAASSPSPSDSPPIFTPRHTTAAWPSLPSPNYGSQPAAYINQDDSVASLVAAYAGLTDHMFVRRGGNCGCVNDNACYNAVLELSLRLRRAADVLSRSPSHSSNLDCKLNSQISDLDILAKFVALALSFYISKLKPTTETHCSTSPASLQLVLP